MPAIRGVYTTHPTTGEEGFWIEPSWLNPGTLVGYARSQWPNVSGMNTTQAKSALEVLLQPLVEEVQSMPGTSLPANHVKRNNVIYKQKLVITATVTTTNPLVVNFSVAEGEYRSMKIG